MRESRRNGGWYGRNGWYYKGVAGDKGGAGDKGIERGSEKKDGGGMERGKEEMEGVDEGGADKGGKVWRKRWTDGKKGIGGWRR